MVDFNEARRSIVDESLSVPVYSYDQVVCFTMVWKAEPQEVYQVRMNTNRYF